MAVNFVDLEFSVADLSNGLTSDVFGGMRWQVIEWAESLGGAWRCVTMTMAVILEAMEPSAFLEVAVGRSLEMVAGGQVLKCRRGRFGLTPMSSTKSPWPLIVLRRPTGPSFFKFFFCQKLCKIYGEEICKILTIKRKFKYKKKEKFYRTIGSNTCVSLWL
jgi:hypothetical protein